MFPFYLLDLAQTENHVLDIKLLQCFLNTEIE